jgi:thiol-disulfide isomerase/thioredoxin
MMLAVLAFVGLGLGLAAGSDLRPFTTKSLDEIQRAHAGRAFVVAFWSVHCGPCKEELSVLEAMHRKFPKVPIVLVAADPPQLQPAVKRFLAAYELGRIETWQFSDFEAKLRFSVDRTWRGELPRTYFYTAAHEVTAQSGVLDPRKLEAWLKRASASPPERGCGT